MYFNMVPYVHTYVPKLSVNQLTTQQTKKTKKTCKKLHGNYGSGTKQ